MSDVVCDGNGKCFRLEAQLQALRQLVDTQAEDGGLWFMAQTAPEAYLQQTLRQLHAAIENATLTPPGAAGQE